MLNNHVPLKPIHRKKILGNKRNAYYVLADRVREVNVYVIRKREFKLHITK